MKLLTLTKTIAFASFKEWLAYRFNMMISVITGPLYFAVQYFIWSAIFVNQQVINGFTLQEMIAYFGILAIIRYVIWDNVMDILSKNV